MRDLPFGSAQGGSASVLRQFQAGSGEVGAGVAAAVVAEANGRLVGDPSLRVKNGSVRDDASMG
jgi:hypothetical protein